MKKETKEKIKSIIVYFSLLILTVFLGSWAIGIILKEAKKEPIKAECINLPTIQIKEIVSEKQSIYWGDWKCEPDKDTYTDLLQPSGVWGMMNMRCIKLEQTIEEYCEEYPTHCDNN